MPHTMRLIMNETQKGSEDGLTIKEFEKGKEYDVAISLAQVFLNEKWASKPEKKSNKKATPKKKTAKKS